MGCSAPPVGYPEKFFQKFQGFSSLGVVNGQPEQEDHQFRTPRKQLQFQARALRRNTAVEPGLRNILSTLGDEASNPSRCSRPCFCVRRLDGRSQGSMSSVRFGGPRRGPRLDRPHWTEKPTRHGVTKKGDSAAATSPPQSAGRRQPGDGTRLGLRSDSQSRKRAGTRWETPRVAGEKASNQQEKATTV